MRRAYVCLMISALVMLSSFDALAFRCGKNLVSEGDHSFKILKTCGEPIVKDTIGYTLTADRSRELKVEHWIYGPQAGYFYILIFEGGVLSRVTSFRNK